MYKRQLSKYDLRVETPNGLTVAYIDEEMAALMKAAGMDTVQLAIESGTEFAHYFLAQAYEKIGGNESKVEENLARYEAIVANNETWRSHADYFGLTEHPRFVRPVSTNFPMNNAVLVGSSL